mmetsp:Transcript_8175/g.10913  ORF Transcript_8175/g.10913 Transcript_8175/m.10913 type:complete len:588 (+) Transcript_8175:117-1880(+)
MTDPTPSNHVGVCRIPGSAYTTEQRQALEKAFETWENFSKQEEKDRIRELSQTIGLTPLQIRGWIQNRKKRGAYKGRWELDLHQVRALEWIFKHHSHYPSLSLKEKLAEELTLPSKRVQTWFQSRRQRGPPVILERVHLEEDHLWAETLGKLREMVANDESDGFLSGPMNPPSPSFTSYEAQHLMKQSPSLSPNFPSSSPSPQFGNPKRRLSVSMLHTPNTGGSAEGLLEHPFWTPENTAPLSSRTLSLPDGRPLQKKRRFSVSEEGGEVTHHHSSGSPSHGSPHLSGTTSSEKLKARSNPQGQISETRGHFPSSGKPRSLSFDVSFRSFPPPSEGSPLSAPQPPPPSSSASSSFHQSSLARPPIPNSHRNPFVPRSTPQLGNSSAYLFPATTGIGPRQQSLSSSPGTPNSSPSFLTSSLSHSRSSPHSIHLQTSSPLTSIASSYSSFSSPHSTHTSPKTLLSDPGSLYSSMSSLSVSAAPPLQSPPFFPPHHSIRLPHSPSHPLLAHPSLPYHQPGSHPSSHSNVIPRSKPGVYVQQQQQQGEETVVLPPIRQLADQRQVVLPPIRELTNPPVSEPPPPNKIVRFK